MNLLTIAQSFGGVQVEENHNFVGEQPYVWRFLALKGAAQIPHFRLTLPGRTGLREIQHVRPVILHERHANPK